ncbi:MAG: aminotransferase class I/II-fold pyridoxal phosphate-dependent enzyme, partial [Deltaproteobacteria bacterium]
MHVLDERALDRLARAAEAGLARRVPPVRWIDATRYELDGRIVVGFCSNDYLGYGSEPVTVEATAGATASRLVCGDHDDVRAAEAALATFAGAEAAVLYPSGYQANVAALSCLLHADDVVYSDRLNHASLIDGIRLSAARPTILPHLAAPPATPQAET